MEYRPAEIIEKKRDGGTLSEEEIHFFISSFLKGLIPEYQMSALLMAIYFNGLNDEETLNFVRTYIASGKTVDLSSINKPKIDKHSTGGVGDKTSVILAPLLACFDVVVPMMSGRGLGHTGGTLDKLESIPGFRIDLSIEEFINILKKLNVSMIGQTDELAPADKKIYALRDVTATVDELGLVTASILSKKIAEGAEGIVYDVKIGSGANIRDKDRSVALAHKLLDTTRKFGKSVSAVLTDMDEPLGYAIGNWLEIKECIDVMNPSTKTSSFSKDLLEVTLTLGGAMLKLADKCKDVKEGAGMCSGKLEDGSCFSKFYDMVKVQGGDAELLSKPEKYPEAGYSGMLKAEKNGYVSRLDAYTFGTASVHLGCGRKKIHDKIDHSAGILLNKKAGDKVRAGETICTYYAESQDKIQSAEEILRRGIEISESCPQVQNKILQLID